jgi:hypothetical protein
MKITKLILIVCISAGMLSCSEDDNSVEVTPEEIENFFPLAVGNFWDYTNVVSIPDQDDVVASERLSVTSTTTEGTTTFYDLETDNPQNAGPITAAFSQGDLSQTDEMLIISGTLGFAVEGLPTINIDVENAPLYDVNASPDSVLFTDSGTIQQEIQGAPLEINYDVETLMGQTLSTFSVNGVSYNDVIQTKIVITLEVVVDVFISIPILPTQEAVVIDNYFAKDVGLILSETNTNLDFAEIDQIPLPLEDLSFISTQSLENYSVDLE